MYKPASTNSNARYEEGERVGERSSQAAIGTSQGEQPSAGSCAMLQPNEERQKIWDAADEAMKRAEEL